MHVSIRNSFGTFNARRIGRFIQEHQIDVVHAHIARDYLVASIACRVAKGAKLVLTRHVIRPLKPFHRFALRNVDAAIAVSPAIREKLERTFAADRIAVIPVGVAPRLLSDEAREQKGGRVSRPSRYPGRHPAGCVTWRTKSAKGQRDLVLAANEVIKRIPECRFVVAGKDNSIDKNFRRELKRLVRVLGHEDRFLWLDWLDNVTPLLAAGDVFVSVSHSESSGLGILEAMSAGTPVIATATEVARELVRDPEYLVPIKDPVALAARICWLLAGGEPEIAEASMSTAVESFSFERMVDATEKVYGDVLGLQKSAILAVSLVCGLSYPLSCNLVPSRNVNAL